MIHITYDGFDIIYEGVLQKVGTGNTRAEAVVYACGGAVDVKETVRINRIQVDPGTGGAR